MENIASRVRKHAGEILRAFRGHKYDVSEGGVYFPQQRLMLAGHYEYGEVGGEIKRQKNLIVSEGILLLLNIALGATAKQAGFYLAPYSGAVNPAASWTAANFTANATEVTSTTEGFSQTTRPAVTFAAASAGAITSAASPATFTIVATTSVTFQGAGMLTSSTRGGTGGTLINSIRFTNPEILNNGATWQLGWSASITDAD